MRAKLDAELSVGPLGRRPPGQAAAARADGAADARVALRSRRGRARRIAPGRARRQPRRAPGRSSRRANRRFPSTVVTLLIDHSGSMRGRPMLIAALTVEIFARVLERCGVQVRGARLHDARVGRRRAGARVGRATAIPSNPAGSTRSSTSSSRAPTSRGGARASRSGCSCTTRCSRRTSTARRCCWAHGRLLARSRARRILVVVSDGTPMDEATLAANGHEYLESHLQAVVDDIETRVAGAAGGHRHRPRRVALLSQRHADRDDRPARPGAHRQADGAPGT